jgi:hypothetical protein
LVLDERAIEVTVQEWRYQEGEAGEDLRHAIERRALKPGDKYLAAVVVVFSRGPDGKIQTYVTPDNPSSPTREAALIIIKHASETLQTALERDE